MNLGQRQEAAMLVEERLMKFLLQYRPTCELKISDAKQIAFSARTIAFEAFEEPDDNG